MTFVSSFARASLWLTSCVLHSLNMYFNGLSSLWSHVFFFRCSIPTRIHHCAPLSLIIAFSFSMPYTQLAVGNSPVALSTKFVSHTVPVLFFFDFLSTVSRFNCCLRAIWATRVCGAPSSRHSLVWLLIIALWF